MARRESSTWATLSEGPGARGYMMWSSPSGIPLSRNPSVDSSASGLSGLDRKFAAILGRLDEDSHPAKEIQSSGKSSLLEGLTGLSFPVSRMICSRFATQVILKQVPEFPSVKATVIPGPSSFLDGPIKPVVISNTTFLSRETFDRVDFANIMEDAAKHMGILRPGSDKRFSDDILNIEITGPDYQNLCVVDLPGLSNHQSIYQTKDDIDLIRSLTLDYMKDQKNIIVAVMDASNEFSDQEIFSLVNMADPTGNRTVGVISKCDVIAPGSERRAMNLARNEIFHLPHGWFVVRNRTRKEVDAGISHQQRHENEEALFGTAPWNELKRPWVGTVALRSVLQRLVHHHTPHNSVAPSRIHSREGSVFGAQFTPQFRVGSLAEVKEDSSASFSFEEKGHHEWDEKAAIRTPSSNGDEAESQVEANKEEMDLEAAAPKKRPLMLINALLSAGTMALTLSLMGLGARALAQEVTIDGSYTRLALLAVIPCQMVITLFFSQAIVGNLFQIFGPISQMKKNSKYYSAIPTRRLNPRDGPLPHVTIQCPVYKEGLETVIKPTMDSLKTAIETYQRQGGTANVFVNDDGMQLISPELALARQKYYFDNNISWVSRPPHNENPKPGETKFLRRGKFKKASNMNYSFMVSNRVEEKLQKYLRGEDWNQEMEDQAYETCLQEVLREDEGRTWTAGNIRIGDYILLVDSDTRVPKDCFLDAVSEMEETPQVAIIQFSSGVMNVTTSFFESGITFFTNLIYTAIKYAVSAGDVSAFVGHNALIRWTALQEISFYEKDWPYELIWSESSVSEDFDMALRLQTTGYIIRLGAYTGDEFKEGVSLTVYDELARWEKYAYGCSELIFHPFKYWLFKGPFTPLFRRFIMSNMPLGSKITIMAYTGTYFAIGFAWISTLLNYFVIGWLNGYLDHFYVDAFKIYFAIIVVFSCFGNVSLAILRYRVENRHILGSLFENFKWVVLLVIFLGGISLHVSQAILFHLFSIDMQWGATSKESEDTTFFIEVPRILYRFKFSFLWCAACTALMICGAYAFPPFWQIRFFTAVWPLVSVVAGHFFLPVLLNPALMKFTW